MTKKAKKKLSVRFYEWLTGNQTTQKRSYAAARPTRLNSGWTVTPTGANYETQVSLSTLIARSREAARDYLHIVNYLRLMRANVIGQKGIGLQSRARIQNGKYKGTLNVDLNNRVEEAWWEWTHAENCTVSGRLDWKGVQDLVVTQCERDGAFLIQMIDADNAFGFALKLWDVTWLDPTFNETLAQGNRVIMSVEIDADNTPVAYWLTTPASEINYTDRRTRTRTRIPADQMIHDFPNRVDESQVQGIPGVAAAVLPAKNAYSYEESVVMASRFATNQIAILKNTMPDAEADWEGAENDDGSPNHPLIDSAPLSITPVLPGWDMQQFKPEHPTQNHPEFTKKLDMKIAAALGVPYFLLIGDWEAVNFSSSRGGLGEFRERCKDYQAFIATTLCRRVFHAWLRRAMLSGKLSLTPEEYREVQNPMWQPRGFDYVDPKKDVETDILQLQYRLKTPSQIALERGEDYLDQLERWESDKRLAAGKGIDIDTIYAQPKQLTAGDKPDEDDDGKKPKGKSDDNEDDESRGLLPPAGYTNGHATHVD